MINMNKPDLPADIQIMAKQIEEKVRTTPVYRWPMVGNNPYLVGFDFKIGEINFRCWKEKGITMDCDKVDVWSVDKPYSKYYMVIMLS